MQCPGHIMLPARQPHKNCFQTLDFTCCVLYWLWLNDKRTAREGWLLPANTPNKNPSSLVKLVELNGDLSQRLASIHPTLNWWQNINRFSRLCIHVRVACEEHHVVNCTSRETSAHWSVDGSLNSNYSYGGDLQGCHTSLSDWASSNHANSVHSARDHDFKDFRVWHIS